MCFFTTHCHFVLLYIFAIANMLEGWKVSVLLLFCCVHLTAIYYYYSVCPSEKALYNIILYVHILIKYYTSN